MKKIKWDHHQQTERTLSNIIFEIATSFNLIFFQRNTEKREVYHENSFD
jgi:hypothetical protein